MTIQYITNFVACIGHKLKEVSITDINEIAHCFTVNVKVYYGTRTTRGTVQQCVYKGSLSSESNATYHE